MYSKLSDGSNVFIGNKVNAVYTPSEIPLYRHNANIEAIPFSTPDLACSLMKRWPSFNESERLLPAHIRLQLVQTISHYVEPLPNLLDLQQRILRTILNGYVSRNPIDSEWVRQIHSGFPNLNLGSDIPGYKPIIRSNSNGFAIIGISGAGKTTGIESGLGTIHQVIIHTEYEGHSLNRVQLVWLKLECPQDGSLKGLCLNFFQAIDMILETRYYEKFGNKRTVDELLPNMSRLAASIGLGVLVVDEIQRLNDAKSGGAQRMLNFFVQLVNTIGVPVILCGTFKALSLLSQDFAMARRSAGQGDLLWFNEKENEIWDYFIENLWRFQWTNITTPLKPELKHILYEESQGIIDIAVKLYQLAQWRVIGEEYERITPQLIRQVADESLQIARPVLEALKTRNIDKLKTIEDVRPPIDKLDQYYKQAHERVTTYGTLNTLRNQQLGGSKGELIDEEVPIYQITQWLVAAGVESNKAQECAKEAFKRFQEEMDLTKAMQAAFQLALGSNNEQPMIEPLIKPKKSKSKKIIFPGDLRYVVKKAASNGISGYDALKNIGYIKSVKEFL